jgi:hypothetical protein
LSIWCETVNDINDEIQANSSGANRSVFTERVPYLGYKICVPGRALKNPYFWQTKIRIFHHRNSYYLYFASSMIAIDHDQDDGTHSFNWSLFSLVLKYVKPWLDLIVQRRIEWQTRIARSHVFYTKSLEKIHILVPESLFWTPSICISPEQGWHLCNRKLYKNSVPWSTQMFFTFKFLRRSHQTMKNMFNESM